MKLVELEKGQPVFCIYITTVCEGPTPIEWKERNMPVVYPTLAEAQRVIVEDAIERMEQFLAGQRDFDDATTIEEYIMEVNVFPDGSIRDNNGNYFGKATN